MLTKRKASDRGHVKLEWLDAYHSFSFGSYFDPKWMCFSNLRVFTEEIIYPNSGYPPQNHQNLDIITIPLDGELEHKDTLGNKSSFKFGEFQLLSTGTGVEHNLYNPNSTEKARYIQIWIKASEGNKTPYYLLESFQQNSNRLNPLITDNVEAFYGLWQECNEQMELDSKYKYWLHCLDGTLNCNDLELSSGDGLAITEESSLKLAASQAQLLFFKLP